MNNDNKLVVLDFSKNLPTPYESKNTSDNTYVTWGLNNLYPNFLIEDLYHKSAAHAAIINQKSNYIIGGGINIGDSPALDIMVNASDSLKEFTSKIIKDYLLFNAFAVEVVFNSFDEPVEYYHVAMHKIRMNKTKTKFWFNEDWVYTRKTIQYDRYNPKDNDSSTSKIFYFDGFFPSLNNVYATPEYVASIKAIVTDAAISEFHLNNIKNHFSPSTIITFFNGNNVDDKTKQIIADDLKTKFAGESGGKIIVDFQHKDGKAAEVDVISSGDWDKAYAEVYAKNMDAIMIGHQVQNPSLFGIKTAGQLGSTTELEASYEMFKNNYVSVKRGEIETALNQLFTNFEPITGKVTFIDKPLFNTQLSDSIKEKVLTIDELRFMIGKEPLPNGLGDRLIIQLQPVTGSTTEALSEDVKKKSRKLSEEDYDLIKHLGVSYDEFEEVSEFESLQFDKQSEVAQYVISNDIKGLKIDELQEVLKAEGNISITQSELAKILKDLSDSGVVKYEEDKSGRISLKPLPEPQIPDTNKVFTMYKYIKKPEVAGTDLIPTSRSFCVKLIENQRLYTREDIQEMSKIFNYDIMKFTGGWYYNPTTDETTSSCRHMWKQIKVKRKNQ